MRHCIQIDDPGKEGVRWVSYNGRRNHRLDLPQLEKTLEEAQSHLWSKHPDLGKNLGQLLFALLNGTGDLLTNLLKDRLETGDQSPLFLQLPKDLHDLPFEIIYENGFLAIRHQLAIVRQVSPRNLRNPEGPAKRPVRILFMACSPQDGGPTLAYEAEEEAIVRVMEEDKLPVDLQFEDSGSLNGLKLALREFRPTDVMHLSGHAGVVEQDPVFEMETDTGLRKWVTPAQFWRSLERHPPRLLFLSGCETGATKGTAADSFAREMVVRGIPRVIGWGLPVSDGGAIRFAKSLYGLLADGSAPEMAVAHARRELADDYETWCQLRVFCDGTPPRPLTDPEERVVFRTPRKARYHLLQQSQVKVLEYGFVGRRRQLQTGIAVLKGHMADKYGLLLTGPAGIGKSTLTGKIVERLGKLPLLVYSGEISQNGIVQRLQDFFDRHRNREAGAILGTDASYESRVKDLFAGPFRQVPALIIFDDFERGNLEPSGLGHCLKAGKAALLAPLLEALPWAEGNTRIIITSRYPFELEAKGSEWVGTRLKAIALMSLRGVDLAKKKRFLTHLSASPHHQVFQDLSGGNPRLLEWFETLAEQKAITDLDRLRQALAQQSEKYIHQYLADLLVAAQEPAFEGFLAKAAVYRLPLPAAAFAPFGAIEWLHRAVALTLMEKEGGEEPVFWVMPLIRERQWAKGDNPTKVHRMAYTWLDERIKATKHFDFDLVDACLHHGARGYAMEGCWGHAVAMSTFFYDKALVREGVARLHPLMKYLPEGDGPEMPENAVTFIHNLASLFQGANRLGEAEPLKRRVLAMDEATYGPDHPKVAIKLNNLATLLQATNRLSEAEPLMRRALAIEEVAKGPDHPHVAINLNNLALLLKATNRLSDAEPLMRRALAIEEVAKGPDHPHVAINLNNLALLLQETNRLAEAEPLMKRALAIDEASFGPDHPDVARDLNNLALLLQDTNRLAEAEPLMRRALAIDETSFGTHHPKVAIDLNNLATLLQDTNRMSDAEPLMRRALAIDEASFGTHHPKVAIDLNNLALLLKATNRLSDAEPLMRRALAIDEASFGTHHPKVAIDLNNLALLLQNTNRMSDAEPLMRRALTIDEASFGPHHPNVAIDLNNLAGLLQDTNRMSEAEPLMKRALHIMVTSLGETHPSSKGVSENYRLLLEKLSPG